MHTVLSNAAWRCRRSPHLSMSPFHRYVTFSRLHYVKATLSYECWPNICIIYRRVLYWSQAWLQGMANTGILYGVHEECC